MLCFSAQAGEYCESHVPGSLNFPLGGAGGAIVGPEDGNFAIWVSYTPIPNN